MEIHDVFSKGFVYATLTHLCLGFNVNLVTLKIPGKILQNLFAQVSSNAHSSNEFNREVTGSYHILCLFVPFVQSHNYMFTHTYANHIADLRSLLLYPR